MRIQSTNFGCWHSVKVNHKGQWNNGLWQSTWRYIHVHCWCYFYLASEPRPSPSHMQLSVQCRLVARHSLPLVCWFSPAGVRTLNSKCVLLCVCVCVCVCVLHHNWCHDPSHVETMQLCNPGLPCAGGSQVTNLCMRGAQAWEQSLVNPGNGTKHKHVHIYVAVHTCMCSKQVA